MTEEHPFVSYLKSLVEDRAALAALRRGLGQAPGTVPAMFRYIVPWAREDTTRWTSTAFYTTAALYGLHPMEGGSGNMGNHFAGARDPKGDDTAIERRFTALLVGHPEDLPSFLRQSISYLKSKDIPVNWDQLFRDILNWRHSDRRVQKRWAQAFWGRSHKKQEES